MTVRRAIVFETGRVDVVTAVVIPIDGVTRRMVSRGVDVQLWDPQRQEPRPVRLVRNASGSLVLLNERADQDLTFRIEPAGAGYRGPLLVTFNPARDGISRVVPLERRPDSAQGDNATLVRGVVVRSGGSSEPADRVPVAGLVVTARPPAGSAAPQFPATTDERGMFVLTVGLRMAGVAEPAAVTTRVRFEKPGVPVREWDVPLDHGRSHVFAAVIDLDGADRPSFTHEARPPETPA